MARVISAGEAVRLSNEPDFGERFPAETRRMITTVAMLVAHLPGEEIEIVDESIYISTGGDSEVISCTEDNDRHKGRHWVIEGLAWDRTHGLSDEVWLGECVGTELPALVRALLERIRRDQQGV